jgi:ERCC4-type nuclease
MIVKIDIREQELIVQLQRLIALNDIFKNINVEKINLPIGDIIIFDPVKNEDIIIIERKTINDLLASIKDGRYEEQSYRLNGTNTHNHNIIYLIEGDVNRANRFKDTGVKDKSIIYSAIFSLNYYKGYSVIRTFNLEETSIFICNTFNKLIKEKNTNRSPFYKNIKFNNLEQQKEQIKETNQINQINQIKETNQIKESQENVNLILGQEIPTLDTEILEQESDKNYIGVIKKIKKENITPNNIDEIMLCQIPGISSVTALALINKFKSISNLIKELEQNSECLKDVTYTNSKNQTKKINKTCIVNIEKYLLKK